MVEKSYTVGYLELGEKELTWEEVLPSSLLLYGFDRMFVASNGIDAYSSDGTSSDDSEGIYYTNLQTGERKLISETGKGIRGFEDSEGNVYISSYLGPFMYCNKDQCTVLITKAYNQIMFETSKGVYATSTNNNKGGIYYVTPTSAKQLISGSSNGSLWENYIESEGITYVTSTHSGTGYTGVYVLDGPTATQIYWYGQDWFPYYRDSNGNLYGIARSISPYNSKSCIVCLENGKAIKVLETPTGYASQIYTWKGELYVLVYNEGIYWIHDKEYTLVIPKYYSSYVTTDNYFYGVSKGYIGVYDQTSYTEIEDPAIYYNYNIYKIYNDTVLMYYNSTLYTPIVFNGTDHIIISELKSTPTILEFDDYIYLCSSSYPGLFYVDLKNLTYNNVLSTGYNFATYTSSKGDTYLYSKSAALGIYKLDNDVATQLYNSAYSFTFFEDSIGVVYALSGNLSGLLTINGDSAEFTSGTYLKYLCNIGDNFYFCTQGSSGNLQHAYHGVVTKLMSSLSSTTNYYIYGNSVYTYQRYSSSSKYTTSIYRIEGSTYSRCITTQQTIPYFVVTNEQVYACSSETPTKDACIVELHDNNASKMYKYLPII